MLTPEIVWIAADCILIRGQIISLDERERHLKLQDILHINTLEINQPHESYAQNCLHVVEAHQRYRRMESNRFRSMGRHGLREDLTSSSSGPPGAGLSEREGAIEAMDGTRLGAIQTLD